MQKVCTGCSVEKPFNAFEKRKAGKYGLHSQCKTCRSVKRKERYEAQRDDILKKQNEYRAEKTHPREYWLKKDYGITQDDFEHISEQQNHVCAICGGVEPKRKYLSVDHCHKSGKVRGLLCNTCNRAIGLFKDDIQVIQKAAEYLKEHS